MFIFLIHFVTSDGFLKEEIDLFNYITILENHICGHVEKERFSRLLAISKHFFQLNMKLKIFVKNQWHKFLHGWAKMQVTGYRLQVQKKISFYWNKLPVDVTLADNVNIFKSKLKSIQL